MKAAKLREAVDYGRQLLLDPVFSNNLAIKTWRGRLLAYDGKEAEGKQVLSQAH